MGLDRVLVVDDDSAVRGVLSDLLRELGYQALAVTGARQARKSLQEDEFDLVISDIQLEGESGIEFLEWVREANPKLPLMIVTGFGSLDTAVAGIQLGIFDYLTKPVRGDRLKLAMERLERVVVLEAENTFLRREVADLSSGGEVAWGRSEPMERVRQLVDRISRADTTVLIQGESGTGKEVVAHALHQQGNRRDKPFISVNCAAVPANLLESEFFGHERGAFTGAVQRRSGRFELANGGTLLLDEISEIPPDLQVKLLRVLQEREYERVGGNKTYQVDVNLIATTNRNLEWEVEAGRFREDLFYRLNVVPIYLPPLRERGEDLIELAHFFIDRFSRKHGRTISPMGEEVLQHIRAYSWPGNVRELQNTIERAVILADDSGEIRVEDLPRLRRADGQEPGRTITTLDAMEHVMIEEALKRYAGNRTHAARALGISLRTLRNKIRKYEEEGRGVGEVTA